MVKFFSPEEEKRIIQAIHEAETQTSGEIRVHLRRFCPGDPVVEARKIFVRLGMHKTKLRNGVLFFLAPDNHRFAIVGDEGIDAVVPPHFWENIRDLAHDHFVRGAFSEGVCRSVELIGRQLADHFPVRADTHDQLPNDISYD